MFQRKEQDKTPEEKPQLSEMETSILPDTEFQILVIKMLSELGVTMYKLNENFSKERKHKKKI